MNLAADITTEPIEEQKKDATQWTYRTAMLSSVARNCKIGRWTDLPQIVQNGVFE